MIDNFIDENREIIYEKIIKTIPEMITNDDWYIEEHYDEVYDFILNNMVNELRKYIEEKKIMNKVFLIGRLTRDIELRYTESNIAVGTTTIAVNRPKQKEKEQEADFIKIKVWGKQAENIQKYLNKGSLIAVEGRIQTGSYTNQEGEKRYITEVIANNVQFLETKKATEKGTETTDYGIEDIPSKTETQQQFEYTDEDLPF